MEKTRSRRPNSRLLIRAERSTLDSHAPPLSRDETIGGELNWLLGQNEAIWPRGGARYRPLRQRPTPLAIPQRTTDHPEHAIERGKHDSQTSPKKDDGGIDDALHHKAHGARTTVATARKPMPGPHAARIVERAGKRDTVAETHFRSNLSSWVGRYVVNLCHTVSYDVNTVLLQHAPNLLSVPRINTSNANATVDITITVLNNFELKRDTVQTENDPPTQ